MKKLIFSLVATALVACAFFAHAQEIATPISAGANESVTVKKRDRVRSFCVERGGRITFDRERANINNSTDADVTITSLPPVSRSVNAILSDTVTASGTTVTFQQFLNLAGKFEEKYRAEDEALAAAKK